MDHPPPRRLASLGLLLLFALLAVFPQAVQAQATLELPSLVLRDIPFEVKVTFEDAVADSLLPQAVTIRAGGAAVTAVLDGRTAAAEVVAPETGTVTVEALQGSTVIGQATTRGLGGWLSILPPVLVIALALAFKRVIPALFLGIWLGAWFAIGFGWLDAFRGLLAAFAVYILEAFTDPGHASIILFSLMIGGMVGIITKNGGMQGVVNKIAGWASNARRGQLATATLGLAVFFDDYANTLVVGNTMRAVTDRLRISREKLAYLVDSTAAPVATIALITTWVGFQLGLIDDAVGKIAMDEGAYSIYLNSVLYSFYPFLAIYFVFAVANSGRDFGPMYRAEVRARTTGQVIAEDANVDENAGEGEVMEPPPGKPTRAINAMIPIATLVLGVIAGIVATGVASGGEGVQDIIGKGDSYISLMWASLLGVLVAGALSIGQRILSLAETVEAWYAGLKSMMFAMIILVMAWALSGITEVLHTADYLVSVLGDTLIPGLVPTLVFILAAATAFSTGSSWGTMSILVPLVVPLVWGVLEANGNADPSHYFIIYSTVSCILAGAVWGDHCSPISDTTILSSMASGCDHIDHVRTQLPYALFVGSTAILLGTLPTGFGFPWWLSMILGIAVLSFGIRFLGKRADDVPGAVTQPDPAYEAL